MQRMLQPPTMVATMEPPPATCCSGRPATIFVLPNSSASSLSSNSIQTARRGFTTRPDNLRTARTSQEMVRTAAQRPMFRTTRRTAATPRIRQTRTMMATIQRRSVCPISSWKRRRPVRYQLQAEQLATTTSRMSLSSPTPETKTSTT